eukprot:TRINITY_DN10251_c0_g1_i1.p3 TRINITY_DN10251_c0_g1~~TRINITY_DN10251_c0_g1_i1.p3  ORF type:complete len:110 (-),score=12.05 TRINITY_DN10251_c0_g1_i1:319-648(-)
MCQFLFVLFVVFCATVRGAQQPSQQSLDYRALDVNPYFSRTRAYHPELGFVPYATLAGSVSGVPSATVAYPVMGAAPAAVTWGGQPGLFVPAQPTAAQGLPGLPDTSRY